MVNFGGIPEKYTVLEKSRIVILPVPYDETSTWIKGSDKGPEAILEASTQVELYDIETEREIYKAGIYTADPITENSSPKKMINSVYSKVISHLKHNKFVVVIGGEHSVSIGSVIAHAENYDDFCVLQLDAHGDLRQKYEGSIYNHACVMARIREVAPFVQLGIRSICKEELDYMTTENVFWAKDIIGNNSWMDKAIDKLKENVYITIDLDVFDPSIMPSTGTPEPGGLMWYETIEFLKKLNSKKNIVGFDIVELCPNEQNKGPDFLAAKLLYSLLSIRFQ